MTKINVTPSTVIAVAASAYILHSTWRNSPDWVKDPFGRKKKEKKDANDDLANPIVILTKLKELSGVIQEKTDEITVDLPWYKLHACFLSLFHLSAEIRKKHPDHRDGLFQACGPAVDKEEAQYLRDMLDYADWAYLTSYRELVDNLHSRGYQVLRHDLATEPGRVGHYIALNYEKKTCLIGLKGTSTFSDVLTDVVGASKPHSLAEPFGDDDDDDDDDDKEKDIICHEGIFTAATMMADDIQGFLEHLIIPQQYRIVITGHSLGAGTACLLGLLLRSRIPYLRKGGRSGAGAGAGAANNNNNNNLKVVAFATPAVLNYTACKACIPFTTSVVNNSDMVPRMSISNLLVMNHGLVEVNNRLEEKGLSPDSLRKAYRYAQDLMKLDEDTLMTVEEWDALFRRIHKKDDLTEEHDLYVPGRVVALYECGEGRDAAAAAAAALDESSSQELNNKNSTTTAVGSAVADGAMNVLRQLELTTTMIQDHFCDSYQQNLDQLLSDLSSSSTSTSTSPSS